MEYAYFGEGTLPDGGEYDHALDETETSSLNKGPFSHKNAPYFIEDMNEKIISQELGLALVNNIANHYVNRGVNLFDLIREGNLGLTHALENFEFEGSSRFSIYAARCIRRNIERAIMRHYGDIQSSRASKIIQMSAIADPYIHRTAVKSRNTKIHHQSV
jgi:RNA polymerase sigma factor (sigma-70 family)